MSVLFVSLLSSIFYSVIDVTCKGFSSELIIGTNSNRHETDCQLDTTDQNRVSTILGFFSDT